jgi:hypothetical protein
MMKSKLERSVAPSWTKKEGVAMTLICKITVSALLTLCLGMPLLQAHSVQVCKVSDSSNPVSGSFTFEIYYPAGSTSPATVNVPVGTCANAITTPSGEVTVIEKANTGTELVSVTATSFRRTENRLVQFNLTTRTAVVLATEDTSGPTVVTFTNRAVTGNQGCTPGFYKNHPSEFTAPYTTSTTVGSVFSGVLSSLSSLTLLQALNGGGGPGIQGAQIILLRAATAALLNAAHPDVSYPLSTSQVVTQVNAALATNNRDTILALADRLDAMNNGAGGCPL